jgi:condensin complex subunit 1
LYSIVIAFFCTHLFLLLLLLLLHESTKKTFIIILSVGCTIHIYRKSTSLSRTTRENLIETICDAVEILSDILEQAQDSQPRAFREAFACHLYMLFQIMFITESEAAANAQLGVGVGTRGAGNGKTNNVNNNNNKKQTEQQPKDPIVHRRLVCAEAMVTATTAMAEKKHWLWKRGVPDEAVVLLPVRIAFVMLERATGVLARKAACADAAMQMIATTFDAFETTCRTFVVAGLLDLMHNQEHMAAITAELCSLSTSSFSASLSSDRLAVELLREYGRLDGSGTELVKGAGSGNKHVAPFVSELASRKPRWVLQQASHVLGHFQSESYPFRSALVTAIGHILEYLHEESKNEPENNVSYQPPQTAAEDNDDGNSVSIATTTTTTAPPLDIQKARATLLDLLSQRIYDVSSYTRSTALKAWINLVTAGALPKERVLQVTKMAMDRLHDKTVMVRKQALQVRRSSSCCGCCSLE